MYGIFMAFLVCFKSWQSCFGKKMRMYLLGFAECRASLFSFLFNFFHNPQRKINRTPSHHQEFASWSSGARRSAEKRRQRLRRGRQMSKWSNHEGSREGWRDWCSTIREWVHAYLDDFGGSELSYFMGFGRCLTVYIWLFFFSFFPQSWPHTPPLSQGPSSGTVWWSRKKG